VVKRRARLWTTTFGRRCPRDWAAGGRQRGTMNSTSRKNSRRRERKPEQNDCVGEEISDRVAECTRPKSYDEEGPKRFAS
jgi:hypothetical protein